MPWRSNEANSGVYITAPALRSEVLSGEQRFFSFKLANERADDAIGSIQAVIGALAGERSVRLEQVLQNLDRADSESVLALALVSPTSPLKLATIPQSSRKQAAAGLVSG